MDDSINTAGLCAARRAPAAAWAKWLRAIALDGRRPAHHELLHADGEGCRVEQDLPVLCQEADDILYEHHKILRQQLIRLKDRKDV